MIVEEQMSEQPFVANLSSSVIKMSNSGIALIEFVDNTILDIQLQIIMLSFELLILCYWCYQVFVLELAVLC